MMVSDSMWKALGRKDCFGLVGMRERVALLGGSFDSEYPKEGINASSKKLEPKSILSCQF